MGTAAPALSLQGTAAISHACFQAHNSLAPSPMSPRVVRPPPEIVRLARRTLEEKEWLRSNKVALYGSAIDVWSLGVVAFELLYGATPFCDGEKEEDVERLIGRDEPLVLPTFTRSLQRVSPNAMAFFAVRLGPCDSPPRCHSKSPLSLAHFLRG